METPQTIYLQCEVHPNNPLTRPIKNCATCWRIYFLYLIASTPKEKQQEFLANLEGFTRIALERERLGQGGHLLTGKPVVDIKKLD